MHTSISKKLLAGLLSVVMVLSLFAAVPASNAQAASVALSGNGVVSSGITNTYKITNLSKTQYAKVSVSGTATEGTAVTSSAKSSVSVKKGTTTIKSTTKIAGTGKAISLKVKSTNGWGKEFKLTVKVYNKSTNKLVKTLTKSVKVYKKTKSIALDQTAVQLESGATATLTATTSPASYVRPITWTTSDAAVATVEGGVVTAVADGTATITAKSGTVSASATIKVGKEEVKEAELVDLKATGSKELTATLSETATVTASDLTVKKGTIKVTPANVTVDGTSVVITLGSKITEGTYSVTYKEKTLEVATEDEKVASLTVVDEYLVETKNDSENSNNGAIAEIEFQALNQYGEPTGADILSVSNTFGGETTTNGSVTDPTAKRNGKITIAGIPAALAVAGTTGSIVIVSKDGVSTTNSVVYSEKSKLAKMELVGIYNKATSAYVDVISAEKAISNYELVIKAYDQYGHDISADTGAGGKLLQVVSAAQIMTNVTVADLDANKKLQSSSFGTVEIDDVEYTTIKLVSSTSSSTAVAGTLKVIVVGDRYGTVMNADIEITQVDLIKSFSISVPDRIYDNDENVLDYTATSVSGADIKDYKTLVKLIPFAASSEFEWAKNTDGTAKLIYTPNDVITTASTSTKHTASTVTSATFTCNADIDATAVVVATKTFTVYEQKIATSVVKYDYNVADDAAYIRLYGSCFVLEDQYGNTMTGYENSYYSTRFDYQIATGSAIESADVLGTSPYGIDVPTDSVLYISVADQSNTNGNFDWQKAQCVVKTYYANSSKAQNITAVYGGYNTDMYRGGYYGVSYSWNTIVEVAPGDKTSGVDESDFYFEGIVNGKVVEIATDDGYGNSTNRVSVIKDTYVPLTAADAANGVVKTAEITFSVQLVDDNGDEYQEEVVATYQYSASGPQATTILSYTDFEAAAKTLTVSGSAISTADLQSLFKVYDQYGNSLTLGSDYTISFDVVLGRYTDGLTVVNNKSKITTITADAGFAVGTYGSGVVTATTATGLTTTCKVYITR